ncbi:MAG TPA: DUF4157 domain-containing protein [Kofleriaceae bacterium]|nr:DUF4157 domain-containing protein [Kofleriaceae bacterium]
MRDWKERDPFAEVGEVYETGTKPGAQSLTQRLPVQRKARAPSTDAKSKAAPPDGDYGFIQAYGGETGAKGRGGAQGGAQFPDESPTSWMASASGGGGGGAPMAESVRAPMEQAFNADFSAVRIHQGDQATQMGAHAYAHGADLHFAPGQYAPDTDSGRSLLGHELAHVVQQAQGRVTATTQLKGVGINDDDALEREADDLGARAARGEAVGAGRAPVVAGAASGVQRFAFIKGAQVTNSAGESADKQAFINDNLVRDYNDDAEFTKHAGKKTDYLGNLKDGTWVRFEPTGINLVGEDHTLVRAEETFTAVNSTSFIYEPFAMDDLSASPEMKAAYETENADRFKEMGVDGVADKQQFGAESLYPKIGYGMNIALPFFTKAKPLDELTSSDYTGQPVQRYLKIAWGMSADAETKVAADRKAGTAVQPKYGKMADTHTAVKGELDAFIKGLVIDGFLGDELKKPGNDKLLAPLAKYALAVENAMIEMAAGDPSSRLDPAKRDELKKKGAKDEAEKFQIFSDWRNFKFEDAVDAATKKGVRYAGMGQNHLKHLIKKGLAADQHPFKLADLDLLRFQGETDALKAKAVKSSFDATPLTTAKLIESHGSTADAAQKKAYEGELKKRNLKVTVSVKKAQENPDEVYVKASSGGRVHKTGQLKMKSGDAHVFLIPLADLWPISGDISIQVFDYDQLSADDMISNFFIRSPWTPWTDKRPWDGAEYETTGEFEK